MEVHALTESSRIAELRAVFESRTTKRVRVAYDVLLARFKDRTCNMAEIAQSLGVTRKAIGDLYKRYFQPIIGKTGRELRQARAGLVRNEMSMQELRIIYERLAKTRTKINLTYDSFLQLFQEGHNFTSIGRRLGIRKETVWRYYNCYFKSVIGLTGTQRLYGGKREKRELILREIPEKGGTLGVIARAAEKAGLTVRRTPKIGSSFTLRKFGLLIDGNLCRIHRLRNVHSAPRTTQRYVRAVVHRTRRVPYVAHIFSVKISGKNCRILVVPTYVLNRLTGREGRVEINIPIHQRPLYHNRAPRIDWWKYENAWHLLDGGE